MAETSLSQLEAAVDSLRDELADVKEELADEREKRRELEQENEEQERRIQALVTHVRESKRRERVLTNGHTGTNARIDKLEETAEQVEETEQRVSQLEDVFTLEQPGPSLEGEDEDAETTLEKVVSWPDTAAENELDENENHARRIAANLGAYVTRTPQGMKLGSSDVKTALLSREGETPHTQTVARVMDFLESLGEALVREDTIKNGERRLYWVEDAPGRLAESSQRDVMSTQESNPAEA